MRGTPLLLVFLFALLRWRGEFFSGKEGGTRVAVWEEWPDRLERGRGKPGGVAGRPGWWPGEVWGPRHLLLHCRSLSMVSVFRLGIQLCPGAKRSPPGPQRIFSSPVK